MHERQAPASLRGKWVSVHSSGSPHAFNVRDYTVKRPLRCPPILCSFMAPPHFYFAPTVV